MAYKLIAKCLQLLFSRRDLGRTFFEPGKYVSFSVSNGCAYFEIRNAFACPSIAFKQGC